MRKTDAVRYPNTLIRSAINSGRDVKRRFKPCGEDELDELRAKAGKVKEGDAIVILDRRVDDKGIIKQFDYEKVKDEWDKTKKRTLVDLSKKVQALITIRGSAPPIADCICEVATTQPHKVLYKEEKTPYCALELEWGEFLYYAIDNEPLCIHYLWSVIEEQLDGGRAWLIDYGNGEAELTQPYFISLHLVDTTRPQDSHLKNSTGKTPDKITIYFCRGLFEPCWAENKGIQNQGAGYFLTDHAFFAKFVRSYSELSIGRTEESRNFLRMYNPKAKKLSNEAQKARFDTRLYKAALWWIFHAEANADKPFAQRVKKNSGEVIDMLRQVAPGLTKTVGKKDKEEYIRDKTEAQLVIDLACWILNYGARQGFFEHFKAIPTVGLYERGKRNNDFCLEIRFAVNAPSGEEKTMRNVQPYTSNLQEELFRQNPPLPPIEELDALVFD